MLDVHMRQVHILTMTLDSYLAERKITEAVFAAAIGTHQSTVNRLRGGQMPSPKLLARIVEVTKSEVTAHDFLVSALSRPAMHSPPTTRTDTTAAA